MKWFLRIFFALCTYGVSLLAEGAYILIKKQIDKRKEPEGYFLNAIHPYDLKLKEFREMVASFTPLEAEKYLEWCSSNGLYLSEKYPVIAEKIGEMYEEDLLMELERLDPDEIEDWIADCKDVGHLLTNKVYGAAMAKKEGKEII